MRRFTVNKTLQRLIRSLGTDKKTDSRIYKHTVFFRQGSCYFVSIKNCIDVMISESDCTLLERHPISFCLYFNLFQLCLYRDTVMGKWKKINPERQREKGQWAVY